MQLLRDILCNDKFLVIIAVLILGLVAMSKFPEATSENIVTAIISGLFGIAVGRSIPRTGDTPEVKPPTP
jgi:hypothetical protein